LFIIENFQPLILNREVELQIGHKSEYVSDENEQYDINECVHMRWTDGTPMN
jgi:hypothetical protein